MYRSCGCAGAAAGNAMRNDETVLVQAGEACRSGACGDIAAVPGQNLAMLCMEDQIYVEGFCPAEALEQGTMFPGLVM